MSIWCPPHHWAPCQLIPPQTCTLMGCFGRGLDFGFCPFFLQQNRRWISICTVVSSLQITFSKLSPRHSLAHWTRFSLLGSRINWQYAAPRDVKPSSRRPLKTQLLDMVIPISLSNKTNCFAVVSSSLCIRISLVRIVGLPDHGNGVMHQWVEMWCFIRHTVWLQLVE